MKNSEKTLAYCLLRIAFGVNFAGHGLFRILTGVEAFASSTVQHMVKSPLPHGFIYGFGLAIPWLELFLGVGLVLGVATRAALSLGALFVVGLTVGVTSNQEWNVASQQLLYSIVFFLLLFSVEYNLLSVDRVIAERRSPGRSQKKA